MPYTSATPDQSFRHRVPHATPEQAAQALLRARRDDVAYVYDQRGNLSGIFTAAPHDPDAVIPHPLPRRRHALA